MENAEKSHQSSGSLRIGNLVGRYKLLAPLAAGGMAHVWAAKPEGKFGFSRTVALKVVRPEYAADTEYARMLIDEATVAGAIHHPNVCELYELDEIDGLLFMVMEWVAGDSLAGLLHQGSKLKPIRYQYAARIVADSCAGVHAAHEAVDADGRSLNIVHRDISPPNILLSQEGQVKVSDFGIAKARYQLHERTRTGDIKGKFAYIPPEQILGKGVSRRSDVYALGCVLYVATLGLRPFGRGPSAMPKIMRGQYRKPRELLEIYPEELEAIIVKALSSDPAGRFETAEELRLALEHWIAESGNVVTPSDIARVVRRRLNPERRQTIEALRHTNKSLLLALAERASRELADDEVTQTPTASSGLVLRPDELSTNSRTSAGRESCTPGFFSGSAGDDHSRVRKSVPPAQAGSDGEAGGESAVSLPPLPSPLPSASDRYVPMEEETIEAGSAAPHTGSAPAEALVPTTPPGPAIRKSRQASSQATQSADGSLTSTSPQRGRVVRWIFLVLVALAVMTLLALGL